MASVPFFGRHLIGQLMSESAAEWAFWLLASNRIVLLVFLIIGGFLRMVKNSIFYS